MEIAFHFGNILNLLDQSPPEVGVVETVKRKVPNPFEILISISYS